MRKIRIHHDSSAKRQQHQSILGMSRSLLESSRCHSPHADVVLWPEVWPQIALQILPLPRPKVGNQVFGVHPCLSLPIAGFALRSGWKEKTNKYKIYIYIYIYMVSCSVFLSPQWYGSPGSTPFPAPPSLLFASYWQHF